MTILRWAATVYAQDKICAELCTRMAQVGFGFDRTEGRRMSERLLALEHEARDRADRAAGRPLARTKSGGFGTKDLLTAFFDDLGAPIYIRSEITRKPSLKSVALRYYASNQRSDDQGRALRELSLAVLDVRRLRKTRVTYIDNCPVQDDERVHPSWLNYGAVSGRFACQQPNLMNLPTKRTDPTIEWSAEHKPLNGGVRGLYRAAAGMRLVIFDAKQLEMRVAAFASGDPTMIAACAARDLHASNAEIIFGEAFRAGNDSKRYALRNLAKQAGFACCYLATAETVWARLLAEGEAVPLQQVQALLRRLHREFAGYFAWQDQRLLRCIKDGFTSTPILGRRRWLGHDPSPTECANFPIQGGAADLMNIRLPMVDSTLRNRIPGARLVAQVHDSGVFEVPTEAVAEAKAICSEVFEAPIVIAGREASFPIDVEDSERWK